MAALGVLAIMGELRIGPFRPAARNRVELVWELAHGSRNLDSERLEEVNVVALNAKAGRRARHCLQIEPSPGYRRVGQPGDRVVVEDVVRSEKRRVGKGGVRRGDTRGSQSNSKTKNT